jgi:hypothetical protein
MRIRRLAGIAATALAIATGTLGTPALAGADPTWAPAATATIHPGVQMRTDGAQCTANFVYFQGTDVFIGYAAHCAGTGTATDTNGCTAGTLPVGTPVEIGGAQHPGTLAYSSWVTMQARGETNSNTCEHNDLALVRIDPRDHGRVNPSVPHWGGPTGVNTTGVPEGEQIYTYGNSSLRGGVTTLSPKTGVSQGTDAGGWNHPVNTAPATDVPGDSGSGMLDSLGRAAGDLSTLSVGFPTGVRNNYSDINLGLDYARDHGGLPTVQLALGTVPFDGSKLPVGTGLPVGL